MVLLAASILSKDGKALLSRQFVEMTRSRIEGLINGFFKLIGTGKQHTFIETDSVRYVYQPLEKIYVLLLTTKASNILEDLETLRLFAKVIPEYSRSLDEYDIRENIFEIIFAFDEIVALGYRENVNLAQIKTFTEMDSHDEKVFLAIRENQEKGAIENMRKAVRELEAKRENIRTGYYVKDNNCTGFGNSSNYSSSYSTPPMTCIDTDCKPIVKTKPSSGNAMQLGGKGRSVDSFVNQLMAEGVIVEKCKESQHMPLSGVSGSQFQPDRNESIHIRIEEAVKIELSNKAGIANMELLGILMLKVSNKDNTMIRLRVSLGDATQLQTHPNIDKKMFQTSNILQSKSIEKAFPVGLEIGLLKWRFQTQTNSEIPLLINCWPTKTNCGCSVNIEYDLQDRSLTLNNVVISICLPAGSSVPVVKEVTGDYSLDASKTHLLWALSVVDADTGSGTLEFDTLTGSVEDFFPLSVTFCSEQTLTGLKMVDVLTQSGNGIKFTADTALTVDKYVIV